MAIASISLHPPPLIAYLTHVINNCFELYSPGNSLHFYLLFLLHLFYVQLINLCDCFKMLHLNVAFYNNFHFVFIFIFWFCFCLIFSIFKASERQLPPPIKRTPSPREQLMDSIRQGRTLKHIPSPTLPRLKDRCK